MTLFEMSGQDSSLKDSLSILSFTDKIIIKANLDTQTDTYQIRSGDDTDFRLSANNQLRLSLSLDYEFIGISLGFSPTFLPGNGDDDTKGKSSYTAYGFRFFLNQWTHDIQYRRAQGFYIENTQDFILDWTEGVDPYIQFPDFKTTYWGGSTSYVLNPAFSLRNVVYNTEWQRKSAGSFIPTLRYGYSKISATLGETRSAEKNFDIGLAPEYYYTAVFGTNWFISPYVSPVLGIRFSQTVDKQRGITENEIFYPFSLDGGVQLGYSSRRYVYGADLKFETTWYNQDSMTTITNDLLFIKLYFGYRFDTPKAIDRIFKKLNKKLGLED